MSCSTLFYLKMWPNIFDIITGGRKKPERKPRRDITFILLLFKNCGYAVYATERLIVDWLQRNGCLTGSTPLGWTWRPGPSICWALMVL